MDTVISTPPDNPQPGQIWYDNRTGLYFEWTPRTGGGYVWVQSPDQHGVAATTTPPTSPNPGDYWYDPRSGFYLVWTLQSDGRYIWVQRAELPKVPVSPFAAPIVSRTPLQTSSASPPNNPTPCDLWYDTVSGFEFIFYDDGNTQQWVVTAPGRGGNQGPPGPPGPPGSTWHGAWSSTAAYHVDDTVGYGGSTYIALKDNTNVTPGTDPTTWQVMAAKGDTGATGPQGPTGPQGIQGPTGATGAQGPPGADSTVPGPTGPQGPVGATGPQGPTGATGAQGIQGIQGIQGPVGPTGATGSQGPAGATGATGPAGPGVPTGGTTGQVLTKTSATDFATNWQTPAGGASVTISDTAPVAPVAGNLWWKSDIGQLQIYYTDPTPNSYWVPAAPAPSIVQNTWRQLGRVVPTAGQATVDFTVLPADINDLMLHWDVNPNANSNNFAIRVYDATGTLDTGNNYTWALTNMQSNIASGASPGSYGSTTTADAARWVVTNPGTGNQPNTINGIRGSARLVNIRDARRHSIDYQSTHFNDANTAQFSVVGSGVWAPTTQQAITGLRLYWGGTTFAAGGVVTLWGSP